jgi:hypothetical protein
MIEAGLHRRSGWQCVENQLCATKAITLAEIEYRAEKRAWT